MSIEETLLAKGYDDLLSPSFSSIGVALKEIVDIPCGFISIGLRYIKREVLEKLDKRINGIPEVDRIPIIPELGIPLLRDLSYYSNEILSNMFIELLGKSADRNNVVNVLPSYIKIIENLSQDEALILEYFHNNLSEKRGYNIPYINLKTVLREGDKKGTFKIQYKYLSELLFVDNLINKDNVILYIENLISLGVLSLSIGNYLADDTIYDNLERNLRTKFPKYFDLLESKYGNTHDIVVDKGVIDLTILGQKFLSAIYPS